MILKKIKNNLFINKGLKVTKKNIVFENNYWKISGAHDGYLIKFGTNYEREIEFYPEQMKFIGYDKLIRKNLIKKLNLILDFILIQAQK